MLKCDSKVYNGSMPLSKIWSVDAFIWSLLNALKLSVPKFYPVCKSRGNWKMSLEEEDVILWN